MLELILIVAAVVLFFVAAFPSVQVRLASVNLLALGLALLALSMLVTHAAVLR